MDDSKPVIFRGTALIIPIESILIKVNLSTEFRVD